MPQVLSKCAADIVWAAGGLQDMGYTVFNLNLGCPSATVTAKGKGAGLLQKPDALDTLLADVFAASPIAVSLKKPHRVSCAGGISAPSVDLPAI